MNLGVYLITAVPPGMGQREVLQNSLLYARLAEQSGFESAWLLEHHFTKFGICSSTVTMAAYLLGQLSRLKVGTAINILPLEHPVRLAEQVALLDQLSGGRFMLGIGRGYFDRDFDVFGGDLTRTRETNKEWLRIMRQAWQEGRCSAAHDLIRFQEVPIYPEPYTKPQPPLYMAAYSPATIEWAAQLGIPLLIGHNLEDEEKAANLELYHESAREHGHDPDAIEHTLSLVVGVSQDPETIRRTSSYYLGWWHEEANKDSRILDISLERNITDNQWQVNKWKELVRKGEYETPKRAATIVRLNPIGTPDECIGKINHLVRLTKAKRLICAFEQAGALPDVLASMALFDKEVRPFIQDVPAVGVANASLENVR